MFWQSRLYQHRAFKQACRDVVGQMIGVSAWGLMTGVAMVKAGMSPLEAILTTVLVYAGSSQLAALPLIMAGAPVWVIWATGLCVNLRFVVFSLHMRSYLMHLPRWQRIVTGYLTGDIGYVMFVRQYSHPLHDEAGRLEQEAYLQGLNSMNWIGWIAASLIGIALANWIPPQWGLGFAGVLCLLAIQCSLLTTAMRWLASAIAAVTGVLAYQVPLRLNIVLAIGVAVIVTLMLESWRPLQHQERK
jgi:predicted branched-subunit amino acid permease